ncbi:MAG: hypothetical protein KDK91_26225 [Gammaproteobacteria bacterium]|nr:hypothetical protein [Gammaproteobacteria bacterium]
MRSDPSLVILWAGVLVLLLVTWRKHGLEGVREALSGTWVLTRTVIRLIPFALLTATFLAQMAPSETVAHYIGEETGLEGMAIAAFAGGLVPSGPFLSFPLALSLFQTGAGKAQVVSFITGWSVYAFYRVTVWEVPMMGLRFTLLRLSASLFLPVLAGSFAGLMFKAF